MREAGESSEDLAGILGFSRTAVYNRLRAYEADGIDALRARAVPGRPPRLTDEQLDWIRTLSVRSEFRSACTVRPARPGLRGAAYAARLEQDTVRVLVPHEIHYEQKGRLTKSAFHE